MQTFINVVPVVVGVWLIFTVFIIDTGNFLSAMVFKVIPFFLGMISLFCGLKLLNVF